MRGRIDTSQEAALTLSELAHAVKKKWRIERTTRTLRRWIEEGREGIYMDRIRIGGVLCSSIEAYERFIDQLNNS